MGVADIEADVPAPGALLQQALGQGLGRLEGLAEDQPAPAAIQGHVGGHLLRAGLVRALPASHGRSAQTLQAVVAMFAMVAHPHIPRAWSQYSSRAACHSLDP